MKLALAAWTMVVTVGLLVVGLMGAGLTNMALTVLAAVAIVGGFVAFMGGLVVILTWLMERPGKHRRNA